MPSSHRLLVCGLALILGACATDPFGTDGGYASVSGLVTRADGTPLSARNLQITCDGAQPVTFQTDPGGHYAVVLDSRAPGVAGAGFRASCRFSVLEGTTPLFQVDATIGFTRPPYLAPLQHLDLHQP